MDATKIALMQTDKQAAPDEYDTLRKRLRTQQSVAGHRRLYNFLQDTPQSP